MYEMNDQERTQFNLAMASMCAQIALTLASAIKGIQATKADLPVRGELLEVMDRWVMETEKYLSQETEEGDE